jgi:hypothetical protein
VERVYRAIDDRAARGDGAGRRRSQASGNAGGPARNANSAGGDTQDTHANPADARNDGRTESRNDGREDGPRAMRTRALGARAHADLAPAEAAREAPEAEADRARERSERLMRGHVQDGAFSMLRALVADLPGSRTPWEQILRTRLAHALSRKPAVSWSRPTRSYIANQGRCGNRRMPWEPGSAQDRSVARLAVIVDVSGSVGDDMMRRFAREIASISRRQQADLVLVIGDDQVRSIDILQAGKCDLGKIEFRGGGGTDFTPLLQGADAHRPDIGVVLTDLEGPAHFRPAWPVIWAVPAAHANANPPFGKKLTLKD